MIFRKRGCSCKFQGPWYQTVYDQGQIHNLEKLQRLAKFSVWYGLAPGAVRTVLAAVIGNDMGNSCGRDMGGAFVACLASRKEALDARKNAELSSRVNSGVGESLSWRC